MKLLTIIAITLNLAGCATVFESVAENRNRQDPCQTQASLMRPENYQKPWWCHAGQRPYLEVRNSQGQITHKIYSKP